MPKLILVTALLFCAFQTFADVQEASLRQNALPLTAKNFSKIARKLSAFKIITLGEMHGSQEVPSFISELFKQLYQAKKNIILGLEIPENDQSLIEQFLQTKDPSLLKKSKFFMRPAQDGRSSAAMVKLLASLPKNAKVVCFDTSSVNTSQERDQKMANNLIKAYQKFLPDHFLILAGNIHAAIEAGTPFDPQYKPMSFLLFSQPNSPLKQSDIKAIKVQYAGGSIWACMGPTEADCKVHSMNPSATSYSTVTTYKSYYLDEALSEGYNATLFFRKLTASPPALKQD